MLKYVLITILLFVLFRSYSQEYIEHPNATKYQQFMDKEWIGKGLPGAILLIRDKNGVWIGAGGYADIKSRRPMTTDMQFPIMSITKSWTAATIMQLQEEGKLDIDDPIITYLPEMSEVPFADVITLRHLMNHTSGIYEGSSSSFTIATLDYFNHNPSMGSSLSEKIKIMEKKYFFEPGSQFVYSGGYELLGVVIERITGKNVFEVIHEKVLIPLNMNNSSFEGNDEDYTPPTRYIDIYGDHVIMALDNMSGPLIGKNKSSDKMEFVGGAGVSTAKDLMLFIESVLKGKLLDANTLADMLHPVLIPENTYGWESFVSYNGGLAKIQTEHGTALGHEGGAYGYSAFVFHSVDNDITIVGFMNLISVEARNIFHDYEGISEMLYKANQ